MLLLIGHGYWGSVLAKNFKDDLYAICDSDSNKLKNAQNLYPDIRYYSNLEEALKDSKVKAVIIATKASTHYEIAKKSINAGKHLWIEKPASINLSQIDELIRLSEKNGVKVFVDHVMCHDSLINEIKLQDIGTPLYFESYRLHQGLYQPDVDVIHDLAVHDLSIIDFLFPKLKLLSKNIIRNKHVGNHSDHAVLNFIFENNFRATIVVSWISPVKQRQICIGGSKAMINIKDGQAHKINLNAQMSTAYSEDKCNSIVKIEQEKYQGLEKAKESFYNMINNNNEGITNLYQAKRIQQWLE